MKYTNELQHIVKLANDVLKTYPTFLGDWVFSTFQVPMSAHLAASKDIHYDWLLPEGELPTDSSGKLESEWLESQTDVAEALVKADNYIKKIRRTIQITWDDMIDKDAKNEHNPKLKAISLGCVKLQDKIIETMAIDQIRVHRDPPLPDDFIPEELTHMDDSEERDLRDWIFLRDSKAMLDAISQLFGHYVIDND